MLRHLVGVKTWGVAHKGRCAAIRGESGRKGRCRLLCGLAGAVGGLSLRGGQRVQAEIAASSIQSSCCSARRPDEAKQVRVGLVVDRGQRRLHPRPRRRRGHRHADLSNNGCRTSGTRHPAESHRPFAPLTSRGRPGTGRTPSVRPRRKSRPRSRSPGRRPRGRPRRPAMHVNHHPVPPHH